MKYIILFALVFCTLAAVGCGGAGSQSKPAANAVARTVEDGYYKGKGVVTKINTELGSVELDHEEIPNVMPAMKMEFSVTDKAMLKPLQVGDTAIFMLEYKQGAEKIASIEKAQ